MRLVEVKSLAACQLVEAEVGDEYYILAGTATVNMPSSLLSHSLFSGVNLCVDSLCTQHPHDPRALSQATESAMGIHLGVQVPAAGA